MHIKMSESKRANSKLYYVQESPHSQAKKSEVDLGKIVFSCILIIELNLVYLARHLNTACIETKYSYT